MPLVPFARPRHPIIGRQPKDGKNKTPSPHSKASAWQRSLRRLMGTADHPPPLFYFGGNHVAPNHKEYTVGSNGPRVRSALSHHTSRLGCGGSQSVQPSGFTASTTEGFTPSRDRTLTVGGHHLAKAMAKRGGLGVSLAVGVVP